MNGLKKQLLLLSLSLFALTSCGDGGSSYQQLQSDYDSLRTQNQQIKQDLDEVLNIIMEVESDIQKVADAENRVRINNNSENLNQSTREQIKEDILYLTQTLQKNREELNRQLEMLKQKDINISALSRKLANLQNQISEKETIISQLQNDLAAKDLLIQGHEATISDQQERLNTQETTIALQDKQLAEQEERLYTAYYCFGTMEELKEQKILAGGGLFSKIKLLPEGFNKDYFLTIDTRKVSTIALFSPRARVRTEHPASSYEFTKDSEGNMTLKIIDAELFWSRGKYLVVEVTP